jgi:site-specific DNA-methyltransferase (adenine-specific)
VTDAMARMRKRALNKLYYGDNLAILREHIRDESVDLVYLDPPFQSGKNYNLFFKAPGGKSSAAQIRAFEDTWQWGPESQEAYENLVEGGGQLANAIRAFWSLLEGNDMMAYITMMAPRLLELRRVMKETGILYLHCDPTASHYLKLLLDAVFGPKNFRNEIIWCYAGGGIPKKDFPRKHDVILRYSRSSSYFYTPEYRPYTAGTMKRGRTAVKGKYAEKGLRLEGTPVNDWWPDVPKITSPTDPEKTGYPTQKSEALLERIIKTSSAPDHVVLDPFCGCGTAVAVAHRLGRPWIGIDITYLATNLIKHRLLGLGATQGADYEIVGEPTTLEDAKQLAKEDTHQFEHWALGLVGARASAKGKGGDRGIDGWLFFHDEQDATGPRTKQIIISVKSGATGPRDLRDLNGVLVREDAQIGVLITMRQSTREMVKEATKAGFYTSPWGTKHPRLQILQVCELLDGKRIDYPPSHANVTLPAAGTAAGAGEQIRISGT